LVDYVKVFRKTAGSYCEKAISFSAKAIQKVQNEEIVRQVFETDRDIDAKEREIENLCLSLLLHQHPVARDLREISAALKMVSDMERIGDQAADIADMLQRIPLRSRRLSHRWRKTLCVW